MVDDLKSALENQSGLVSNVAKAEFSSRQSLAILGAMLLGVLAFLSILDLMVHGGLLTLLPVLTAVGRKAPTVDVDSDGLQTLFIAAAGVVTLSFCWLLRIDARYKKRLTQITIIIFIFGGGFIINSYCGESSITEYMTAHGYTHCPRAAYFTGNGKSRVYFARYVLNGLRCPIAPPAGRDWWVDE